MTTLSTVRGSSLELASSSPVWSTPDDWSPSCTTPPTQSHSLTIETRNSYELLVLRCRAHAVAADCRHWIRGGIAPNFSIYYEIHLCYLSWSPTLSTLSTTKAPDNYTLHMFLFIRLLFIHFYSMRFFQCMSTDICEIFFNNLALFPTDVLLYQCSYVEKYKPQFSYTALSFCNAKRHSKCANPKQ